MRVYDRDLIRGGHYGQRSCEPHSKAEHMAAPTNAAKREESPCQLGAVHTWHKPAVGGRAEHVRSAGVFQTSTCSAIARASSTSMPRYLTVLSILVWPSSHAPYYASSYLIETQRLVEQDLVLPDLLIASGRQKRPCPPP